MSSGGGNLKAVVMTNLKASPVKSTILIVGFIVLVVLVVRQVGGGPKEAAADELVPSIPVVAADAKDTESPAMVIAPRVPMPRIGKKLARDPFATDWLVIQDNPDDEHGEDIDVEGDVLALQLTLTGEDESGRATAVVSGTVVHVGDQVADYVIERIEKRSLVLRKGQEIIKLRMP